MVTLGLLTVFFLIGGIAAGFKSSFWSSLFVFFIWIGIIFVLPNIKHDITNLFKSNKDSIFSLELKKQEILSRFEDYLLSEAKKIRTRKEQLKFLKEQSKLYPNNELKIMKKLENDMINKGDKVIKNTHLINVFFPTSFYTGLNCELSSKGCLSLLELYKQINKKQVDIVTNYTLNESINYIGVIQGKSKLPKYLMGGVLVLVIYVVALMLLLYSSFKRTLFPRIKKNFTNIKINAKKGDYVLLNVGLGDREFSSEIFNISFSSAKFKGELTLNKKNISELRGFFLYDLADTEIKHLKHLSGVEVDIKKSLREFSYDDLLELFPQINESDFIIFDNIELTVPPHPNKVIIAINSQLIKVEHTKYIFIALKNNSYVVTLDRKEK